MKIGFFTDSYLPMNDGVATTTEKCAQALERRGHEVYIIAPRQPRYKDKRENVYRLTSIKVVKSPEIRWALSLPEKSLLKILRINFDIVHGHSGGGVTFTGLQIAKAKGIPYVATYHTLWNRYSHYFMYGKVTPKMLELTSKFVGNMCDSLIAPTDSIKKELIGYGVTKPIHILPNGINLADFRDVEKGFLRKKRRIPSNKKILLYVGRLAREKSVNFLIESFQNIHARFPDTVLVLVGNGSEKENLTKLVKSLKLQNSVYFIGSVKYSNIAKVYADADLFVFSSQTETQGMVVLEAFASGLPVISLEDDVFNGVIENGKNGFTVKKDSEAFSKKVIKLLNDPNLMEKFSKEAHKTAEKFSVDEMAKNLENIYLHIMQTHKSKRRNIKNLDEYIDELKKFFLKAKTQIRSFEI
jgi:glycosyltransferase involved in cell wall biosynthesis